MLILAHSTVGLIIGTAVQNPVLSFFLAWFSHYILDFIPHSDTGYFKNTEKDWLQSKKVVTWVFVDAFLSIILFYLVILKTGFAFSILAGYLGSLGPDILDNSPFWSKALHKVPLIQWEYKRIHNRFHNTAKEDRTFIFLILVSYIINIGLIIYLLR
jgi:hypothetical protein